MSLWYVVLLLPVIVCLTEAGNNTVTDEVSFDVVINDPEGEDIKGRIVFGVFGQACPISALNFVSLARGYIRGHPPYQKLTYKGSEFHRVVPDFVIQAGDIDGVGGRSIYGHRFDDEVFVHSHKAAGYTSWANHGYDTNGSQFFITLAKARWLDGKHVVFAKVLKGMEMVAKIGTVPSAPMSAIPQKKIKVLDTTAVHLEKPYDLSADAMASDYDVPDSQKLPMTPDEYVTAPSDAKKPDAKKAAAKKA